MLFCIIMLHLHNRCFIVLVSRVNAPFTTTCVYLPDLSGDFKTFTLLYPQQHMQANLFHKLFGHCYLVPPAVIGDCLGESLGTVHHIPRMCFLIDCIHRGLSGCCSVKKNIQPSKKHPTQAVPKGFLQEVVRGLLNYGYYRDKWVQLTENDIVSGGAYAQY